MSHKLLWTAGLAAITSLLFAAPAHAQSTDPESITPLVAPTSAAPTSAQTADAQTASIEAPVEARTGGRARDARNSLFFEAIGAGIYPSINYERMLTDELGLRVGLSVASFAFSNDSPTRRSNYFGIPLILSYTGVRTDRGHGLELGAGATLAYVSRGGPVAQKNYYVTADDFFAWGDLLVGYRYQPPDGGFQFRVGGTALIGPFDVLGASGRVGWMPWAYVSFGGAF